MKIVLASRNKKKISELQALFSNVNGKKVEILSLDDIGYFEDTVEDGTTFAENAYIKASAPKCNYIVVADDSGICVDALNGAPGIFSARYSGEHGNDETNNDKLLKELENVPDDKRTAHYTCAISCVFPDGREPLAIEEICKGIILHERNGEGGFGYDPLFFIPECNVTFAQMSPEDKNKISHRGKAMRKLVDALAPIIDNYN